MKKTNTGRAELCLFELAVNMWLIHIRLNWTICFACWIVCRTKRFSNLTLFFNGPVLCLFLSFRWVLKVLCIHFIQRAFKSIIYLLYFDVFRRKYVLSQFCRERGSAHRKWRGPVRPLCKPHLSHTLRTGCISCLSQKAVILQRFSRINPLSRLMPGFSAN